MSRNVMIAAGVLLAAALLLYLLLPRPESRPDPQLARLVDAAQQFCLSSESSGRTATVGTTLDAIKGLKGTASVATSTEQRRGAVQSLSGALQAEQDDKIRACMQPFVARMLQITK